MDKNSFIKRMVYLELNMLSPIIIMCISLIYFDLYTFSILLYNSLSLAIFPLIYIKFLAPPGQAQTLDYYLKGKLENLKKQSIIGIILLTVIYLIIVINYDIGEHYFRKELIDKIVINFDKNILNFLLLVFLFGIVNPCLEEFFWRNFIPQAVFDLMGHPYNHENNNSRDNRNNSAYSDLEDNNPQEYQQNILSIENSEKEQPPKLKEELYQILFCLHYASYHFFVVLHITNVLFAVIGTIVVAIAGRFFLFVNTKVGYLANALAHMGADQGFCTIALVIFYHNKIIF